VGIGEGEEVKLLGDEMWEYWRKRGGEGVKDGKRCIACYME
jgi:hypothetical protein